jgi:Sulfotransferase family
MTERSTLKPVIVCGPPRSGTTFLTALLNGHPDFLITNESRLFSAPLHIAKSIAMGGLSQTTGPLALEFAKEMEFSASAYIRSIYSRVRKLTFLFSDHEMMTVVTAGCAPKYVGDKFPGYSADQYAIARTHSLVPDAKWLFIFRQIAATIRSQMRMNMAFDVQRAAIAYIDQLQQAAWIRSIVSDAHFLLLSYDKLISLADRGREVERLAAFFGVSPEPFGAFLENPDRSGINYSSGDITVPLDASEDRCIVEQIPFTTRERIWALQQEAGFDNVLGGTAS